MGRLFVLVALSFLLAGSVGAELVSFDGSWGEPGYNLVSQTPGGVEVVFSVTRLRFEDLVVDGEVMKVLNLPGVFLPNNEGAPNLPGMGRYIAIPQGSQARLRVVASRKEVYPDIDIAPAPPIPLETDDSPPVYKKDFSIYGRDAYYPLEPVRLSEPMSLRGVDVVILGITPFQYNPVTRELIVYKDLRVRVDFIGGNGHFGEDRLRSRFWEPVLQGHLLNYGSLPEIDFYAPSRLRQEGWEYVIIVPDDPDFIAWADTIKRWRKLQGIYTEVFNLSDIGGNTVSAIEGFVDSAYYWAMPPVAFLLLSDYQSSGRPYGITSPVWNSYCVSDNIYADIDGDDLPELNFARITAQGPTHLQEMVPKFLDYERNPPTDVGFYDHPLMACGWQTPRWFQLCTEIIRGFMMNELGKDPARQYNVYSGTPSPGCAWSTNENTWMLIDYFGSAGLGYIPDTNPYDYSWWDSGSAGGINTAINSGAFIVQHRDHGEETGWGEPNYHISDLTGLSNDMPTFVFSINCLTGRYDWSSECFAEAFHRMHYGALGLIAASDVSYSFVNDTYVFGYYDLMWPDFDPGYPLGEMPGYKDLRPGFGNASGKHYLEASSWPYNPQNKVHTYHLFHMHGDAFTTLYSEVPQNLAVSHPGVLRAGQTSFPVSADDSSVIALTVSSEIIGVAEGMGGAPVNITIPAQTPGDTMVVTVTKANYFRYEFDCPVIADSGPYVIYLKHLIDDVAGGNGDGNVNPGESIEMPLWVRNWGNEAAGGVSGTLRISDSFVSITDSVKLFGHIEPGDSIFTGPDGYSFQVSPACTNGHWIVFELVTADSLDSTWTSNPSVRVGSPVIVYRSHTIDDQGQPYPNSGLDPGEMAWLEVEIENEGFGNAYQVIGFLATDDTLVTVHDSRGTYGDVLGGDRVSNGVDRFVVGADPQTPWGYEAQLTLYLTGAYGFADTLGFALRVGGAGSGVVGPCPYGYYAYDDTDLQFTECPTYSWTEISGVGTALSLGDDETITLPLPFTFKYYGLNYNQISVCSNGFQALDSTSADPYVNEPLPSTNLAPAGVCPFWDDLRSASGGGGGTIYYYYDDSTHTYIVEYSQIHHYPSGSPETFEAVFYDPVYDTTVTGDGEIICHYNSLSDPNSCTIGIQDHSQTIALQYGYNNAYDPNAAPLEPARAVKFTTDPPVLREGPCLHYYSHTSDDSIGGNNNGVVEPGESIELVLVLANNGTQDATNVQGVLRTDDPDVTIDDSTGTFGDIAIGGQGNNDADRFVFTVTDPVQDDVIEFEVLVTADGGYQTTALFPVYIGWIGVEELAIEVGPRVFGLSQNYPNPFSHSTYIRYQLPVRSHTVLKVYDVSGRVVNTLVDGEQKPGFYSVAWDGRDSSGTRVASGVYFYRLSATRDDREASAFTSARKVVVLK